MRVGLKRSVGGCAVMFVGFLTLGSQAVAAQTPPAGHQVATTVRPEAFGTQNYTVTTISALSFVPGDRGINYHTSGSLARMPDVNAEQHFYSALDVPAGVVIDFIGFNNLNDGEANVMAIHLFERDQTGGVFDAFDLDNTPHID